MPRTSPRAGRGPVAAAGALTLLLAAAAGCDSAARPAGPAPATPPPTARPAPADRAGDRVGPLFLDGLDGDRYCTASVVHSRDRDLLITAAHCAAPSGRPVEGLVFAPGYRNQQAPYGSWPISAVTVDPRWGTGEDDEQYDVAFLTVEEVDGRRIEDVVGAEQFGSGPGSGLEVTVTGYPNADDFPITCRTRATSDRADRQRFDCAGFADGTSGSPWVTDEGRVVGVIGGYQQGGDSPDISYSVVFGDPIADLYRQADGD
ncbi:serine protease [Streptomyces sp. TLI_171]|uniref:trypsin-like serine peptidase n=1 Tax=Streptomyces sp. TLI_171 TaxID=1938859 RepID=UPI000C18952C|nr:serine protease [Streptomyces sp. TLI_171]RKE18977.1 V8-like Glu-specific endopeptidase [Streptomyces sp. TLI_171]